MVNYLGNVFQIAFSGAVIAYLIKYHAQDRARYWGITSELVDISMKLRNIERTLEEIPKRRGPKPMNKSPKRKKKNA